jgi:hypothetical protein
MTLAQKLDSLLSFLDEVTIKKIENRFAHPDFAHFLNLISQTVKKYIDVGQ